MGDVESTGPHGEGGGSGSVEDSSDSGDAALVKRQGTVIQRHARKTVQLPAEQVPSSSSSTAPIQPPPPSLSSPEQQNHTHHHQQQQQQQQLVSALKHLNDSLMGLSKEAQSQQEEVPTGVEEGAQVCPVIVPFRSASFSQIDLGPEGNYFLPRSPITLKPSAFCLSATPPPATTLTESASAPNTTTTTTTSPPSSPLPPAPATPTTLPRTSKPPTQHRVQFQVGDPTYVDPATFAPHLQPQPTTTPTISEQINNGNNTQAEKVLSTMDSNNQGQGQREPEVLLEEEKAQKAPRIVREESGTLSTSSEEGSLLPPPLSGSEKAKMAFKTGLHAKLPLLDLDGGCGSGASGSVSGSGGEEEGGNGGPQPQPPSSMMSTSTSAPIMTQLIRQSSGQSDGSEGFLSDPCASPPTSNNILLSSITNANATTSPSSSATTSSTATKPRTMFRSSGGLSSPPPLSSSSGYNYRYNYPRSTPGSPPVELPPSRTNSVGSTSGTSPRRYYKRPLRGPYGEMLEAEMNRVGRNKIGHLDFLDGSGRKSLNRELESMDFCRESRSSSPPPNSSSGSEAGVPLLGTSPKLGNSLHELRMTGWLGDGQLPPSATSTSTATDATTNSGTKGGSSSPANNKYLNNPRARKISANIPMSGSSSFHANTPVENVGVFHQRTASSPSQLSSTATSEPKNSPTGGKQRRPLDASPRGHVLAELVETERSYVDSLRILVQKYMEPLKTSDFIETGLVDEIFFQIPAILWHHERILEALQRRVVDDQQSVGDVLLEAFRQNSLLECYSLFVNNWKNAKGSLKMAVASKPQLARFLETNARQHKGKLSIDSLLIMPIQRIPRYELLVKELLKHTEPTHEDHSRLMLVLERIKKFAVHIDCASVDPNDNREIEIEGWAAGLGHLVSVTVVTIATSSSSVRKERALFLFADSIVIASIKRKSSAMRKTSSNQFQSGGGGGGGASLSSSGAGGAYHTYSSQHLDGCKFKLLLKVGLMDVHTAGVGGGEGERGEDRAANEDLEDLKTLHKMMDLAALLKCPHAALDELLAQLAAGLRHPCDNNADLVELEIRESGSGGAGASTTTGGSANSDANSSSPPEILRVLFGSVEKKNAWLDSFQDTVGKFIRYGFGRLSQMTFVQALPIRKTRAGLQLSCAAPVWLQASQRVDVWVANSDGYVGQICILTLHPEPAITSCNGVCNSRITCILSVPPLGHSHDASSPPHGYESEDDGHRSRTGHKSSEHWSVWLGTEDGGLQIYDCSDSVRVKKSKHKVQHKAPLNCMAYYDSRVFVSLGNGDVAMYSRNAQGKGWLVDPVWITIGSGMNPVTRMITTTACLWCVESTKVKVYSSDPNGMLELLQALPVSGVCTLAATDDSVWVAQASSVIKCYSNSSFELLFHMDVGPEVSKILSGCDDIIRQHKSACLRVTALLVAPDHTVWIGTSAGVILTLSSNSGPNRKCTPLPQGHTGQVRFLSCCTSRDSTVVISGGDGYEEFRPGLNSMGSGGSGSGGGGGGSMDRVGDSDTGRIGRNLSAFASVTSSSTFSSSGGSSSGVATVVGGGGESGGGDLSGREDSTNHLLIWRAPSKPLSSSSSSASS